MQGIESFTEVGVGQRNESLELEVLYTYFGPVVRVMCLLRVKTRKRTKRCKTESDRDRIGREDDTGPTGQELLTQGEKRAWFLKEQDRVKTS